MICYVSRMLTNKPMPTHNSARCETGFTLIELLVTVSIMGILLAVGLPSFQNLSRTTRLTTQANIIVSTMHLARNEAITRGHPVRIVPVVSGTDWTSGWSVVLDVNGNNAIDSGTDTLVRRYDGLKKSSLVSNVSAMSYKSNGFIDDNSGATTIAFTITDNDCVAPQPGARKVTVSLSGHASTEKDDCL